MSYTVAYVAASPEDAAEGADELSSVAASFSTEAVTTADVDTDLSSSDCVVFAETPTTSDGAAILDVIEAIEGTPLVVFADSAFAPEMAASTDGIDGYVRSDTEDPVAHLADEVSWICATESTGVSREASSSSERDGAERDGADRGGTERGADRAGADLERYETAAAHLADRLELERKRSNWLEDEVNGFEGERHRFERELAGIEADRDRSQAAFRTHPTPSIRYDVADGRITDVTDAFATTFDLDPADCRDRNLRDVFAALGVETTSLPESFKAALAGAPQAAERVERRCPTVDGPRSIAFEVATGPDPSEETGSRIGVLVCRDVTDVRTVEHELAAVRSRLETVAERIESEARPPLNVARGYLELAQETGDEEHFAEIDAAHYDLGEAIDDIAGWTCPGGLSLDLEPVELHALTRRAWVAVETGDAQLELGANARFEADVGRLTGLFEHLLDATTTPEAAVAGGVDDGQYDRTGRPVETDGGTASDALSAPTVSVGAMADGFYLAGTAGSELDRPGTDAGTDEDETGLNLGLVERVADAHGWQVEVAERAEGMAFAFRDVDVEPVE